MPQNWMRLSWMSLALNDSAISKKKNAVIVWHPQSLGTKVPDHCLMSPCEATLPTHLKGVKALAIRICKCHAQEKFCFLIIWLDQTTRFVQVLDSAKQESPTCSLS